MRSHVNSVLTQSHPLGGRLAQLRTHLAEVGSLRLCGGRWEDKLSEG